MKTLELPKGLLCSALAKSEGTKEFISVVRDRLKAFEYYYHTTRIRYVATIELAVESVHREFEQYPDEKRWDNKRIYLSADDTIVVDFDFHENPEKALLGLMTRHVQDLYGQIPAWEKVTAITANIIFSHISEMYVWGSEHVGCYHEEQECGEGWITMTKEPEKEIRTFVDINDD